MSPEARAALQRRLAEVAAAKPAVSTKQVVHAPLAVANATDPVANAVANISRHGKYADLEKRRAYMRDLMRKKRAPK